MSQAYAIACHLLGMVEQNTAVQRQRLAEAEHGLAAMQALWGRWLEAGRWTILVLIPSPRD